LEGRLRGDAAGGCGGVPWIGPGMYAIIVGANPSFSGFMPGAGGASDSCCVFGVVLNVPSVTG
jgi:hypothetical protein